MVKLDRTSHTADHRINCYAGCSNPKYRRDQGLCPWCIRTNNSNSYRGLRFWRANYYEHYSRHFNLNGCGDFYDSQDQKVKQCNFGLDKSFLDRTDYTLVFGLIRLFLQEGSRSFLCDNQLSILKSIVPKMLQI